MEAKTQPTTSGEPPPKRTHTLSITSNRSSVDSKRFWPSLDLRLPFQKKEHGLSSPLVSPIENKSFLIESVKAEDLSLGDVVIVVMGPTGAGKSTFIQTATPGHDNREVGHGLESTTSEVKAVRVTLPDDTHVVLVDTPGFDDTYLTDLQVLQVIAKWLKNVRSKHLEISGILYLHRISDNRMAGTPLKNLAMFQKLCGEDFFEKVVLTTTMWPDRDPEETQACVAREKDLEANYWSEMMKRGSTIHRFMNTKESAWDIIDHIIAVESERQWVQIQEEMVTEGKKLPSTEAGQELHGLMQERIERQNEILRRMKDEFGKTADKAVLHELLKELGDLQREQAKTEKDMHQLDPSTLGFFARLRRIPNPIRRRRP